MDYLEVFKAHLKVSEAHNGAVGYHNGIAESALLEKHNIIIDAANEEQKIESNIKSKGKYMTGLLLIWAEKLRYKKLKTEIKNNYIMVLVGYLQDLPGVIKIANN